MEAIWVDEIFPKICTACLPIGANPCIIVSLALARLRHHAVVDAPLELCPRQCVHTLNVTGAHAALGDAHSLGLLILIRCAPF